MRPWPDQAAFKHTPATQGKTMTSVLLKPDPGSLGIIRQSLRDRISELRP